VGVTLAAVFVLLPHALNSRTIAIMMMYKVRFFFITYLLQTYV
jgi:hypothetical protein